MATNKRPSFLKRQKEQQRVARAAQKREERRLRKRSNSATMDESVDQDSSAQPAGELEETPETEAPLS